jgi:threonine aldolase
VIPAEALLASIREEDEHHANVTLVCAENTHNRGGGRVVPLASLRELLSAARSRRVRVHLDGARLWNASVATGVPLREWAACADTVMMCFSKGLGAPIGSMLVGSRETMVTARRLRKRFGGGMRQVGILAAACLHALDHHVERLADDHARARRLAAGFRRAAGLSVPEPDTNIVLVDLEEPALDVAGLVRALDEQGVKLIPFGRRRLRAVTHLDVDDAGVARAIDAMLQATAGVRAGRAPA